MSYNKGIRKVFSSNSVKDLCEAKEQAEYCGYSLLTFNGIVYVRTRNSLIYWVETELNISDFQF